MAQAVPARLDMHFGVDPPAADRTQARSPAALGDIRIAVYEDLSATERDWRAFEPHAVAHADQALPGRQPIEALKNRAVGVRLEGAPIPLGRR